MWWMTMYFIRIYLILNISCLFECGIVSFSTYHKHNHEDDSGSVRHHCYYDHHNDATVYQFQAENWSGRRNISLSDFRGKVWRLLLLVYQGVISKSPLTFFSFLGVLRIRKLGISAKPKRLFFKFRKCVLHIFKTS